MHAGDGRKRNNGCSPASIHWVDMTTLITTKDQYIIHYSTCCLGCDARQSEVMNKKRHYNRPTRSRLEKRRSISYRRHRFAHELYCHAMSSEVVALEAPETGARMHTSPPTLCTDPARPCSSAVLSVGLRALALFLIVWEDMYTRLLPLHASRRL